MNPLVSIIMPVYNAEAYLHDSIGSVLEQSYINWELLICDDASTDNSVKIFKTYNDSRIRFFSNSSNLGYLKTCNQLFLEARGKFITWQDADDITHRTRLEKQLQAFKNDAELDLCGTQALYFDTDINKPKRIKSVALDHQSILVGLATNSQFCGASVMVKKNVLFEHGCYNSYYDRIGNEDYDCFYRIAEKGKVMNLSEILYYVRLTPNSISRKVINPRQLISHHIVQFLANQRKQNHGMDSLTGLNLEILKKQEANWLSPYEQDHSLVKREEADKHAYNGMLKNAFYSSLSAFMIKPKLINLKYVITCFLRMLF